MKDSIKKKKKQSHRKPNLKQDGIQIKPFWLNKEEEQKYNDLLAYHGVSRFSELYRLLSTKEHREVCKATNIG